MIIDGKAFAREIEEQVKNKVRNLPAQAGLVKKPRIVSVMVGDDPASALYTRLKKAAAERVGVQFDIVKLDASSQILDVRKTIEEYGKAQSVTGVMVQLPIPGLQGQTLQDVLSVIPLAKDVDGLRWEESGVMPATVRAVLSILDEIANRKSPEHSPKIAQGSELWNKQFVVLGARGAVGKPLVHWLRQRGVDVTEVEWDTPDPARRLLAGDVVISCVGKAGMVTGEMVQDGVIAIDVGMSEVEGKVVGDMTNEVYQKASVAVPVPGGVGPVTVASLMANAADLVL